MIALGGQVQALTQVTTDPGALARRGAADPARRQPRVLRRTGALPADAQRIHQDAARSASGQRSAEIRDAAGFRRSAPGSRIPRWSFIRSAARSRTGPSKTWSRRGASSIPSGSASRPPSPASARPPRKAHRHAAAERQRAANARPWTCPRTAARRSSSWDSTRPTDSAAAKSASIRRTPAADDHYYLLGGAHRSAQGSVHRRRPPAARANCISAPRSMPPATRHSRWKRSRPESPPTANLSSYAFVVLNDLGSVPAESGRLAPAVRDRRRLAAGRAGPGFRAYCRACRCWMKPIQASSYAGREGDRFLTVSDIDTGHPALRSVERFNGVKFYQAIHVSADEIARAGAAERRHSAGARTQHRRRQGAGVHLDLRQHLERSAAARLLGAVRGADRRSYLGGGGAEQPVNLPVDSYVELRSAGNGKGAAAEVLGSRRQARAVARRSRQGPQLRAGPRRLLRNENRRRPPQPDRGARRPPGIRPGADSAGDAGPVEGHRSSDPTPAGAPGANGAKPTQAVGPLALHFIVIVR